MQRKTLVNFGNLLLSLSEAMDLAGSALAQHQQRAAFIAWGISKAAGLPEDVQETIFTASLLHDVGAMSVEEKTALHCFEDINVEGHCRRGELLLERSPLLKHAANIVRHHHRKWEEWDEPIDTPDVLAAQVVYLSDYLERLIDRDRYILHQHHQIIETIKSLAGTEIHPRIVDYFLAIAFREEFWLDLVSSRLYPLLLHNGPYRTFEIDLSGIMAISELFRDIIDFRSRFTATHTSGVAASAEILAKLFGLTETETQLMKVAGNFHDIGKLSVPNSILEKPDKLTKDEFAVMKGHTYYTYYVIHTIGGLQSIAEWAAYHHEKLDGSGYPFHCRADELSTCARIMTVADLFTAIAEDRPYRKGMTKEEIFSTIRSLASQQLIDGRIVNLLFENYDQVRAHAMDAQAIAKEFYETRFSGINAPATGG